MQPLTTEHCGSVHYITIGDSRLLTEAGLTPSPLYLIGDAASRCGLSRVGYFMPFNGRRPLNGHPPSTVLLLHNQVSLKYHSSGNNYSPASFTNNMRNTEHRHASHNVILLEIQKLVRQQTFVLKYRDPVILRFACCHDINSSVLA